MPAHDTRHGTPHDTPQLPSAGTLRARSTSPQEVFLGVETDQCSGSLSVLDRTEKWIPIRRGRKRVVDVALTGDGHWFWRCGTTLEKSRGEPNYRQRVKRLKVTHSTSDREIRWECFDLL
jgi:hypothetical protein